MKVTGINIYPIKATTAVALQAAEVRPRGLAGDRRWVIVDEQGQFLSQRGRAQLALVKAALQPAGGLLIEAPDASPLAVDQPSAGSRITVTVWSDTIDAADAGDEAAAWFSTLMGSPCRLAFMDGLARRAAAGTEGGEFDQVSFADAMPVLLCSQASLIDLNRRISLPVPMSRFRPNLVIDGDEAWNEDDWTGVRIGDVEFKVTHPCVRCVVTTTDQETGERSPDREPLKTLAAFRSGPDGVLFGQNLLPRNGGTVRVGDPVSVLDRK